jgi:hypothetical protein
VKVDLKNQGRNFDFSEADTTRPAKTGTLLPGTCVVGEVFYKTDAAAGSNLYGCTAANVWTVQGGSSGGSLSAVTSGDGSITTATIGTTVDLAANAALVATATSNNDLTGTNTISYAYLGIVLPNEVSTGTVVYRLAKLSGSSVVMATTSDTSGLLGVVQSGAGATGNARTATRGAALCDFDGSTTAGHYVRASTSSAGKCSDAGASRPASGQVLGYVTSTNVGAGVYTVLLEPDVTSSSGASKAVSVRKSDNSGACTLTFTNGVLTSQDCTL